TSNLPQMHSAATPAATLLLMAASCRPVEPVRSSQTASGPMLGTTLPATMGSSLAARTGRSEKVVLRISLAAPSSPRPVRQRARRITLTGAGCWVPGRADATRPLVAQGDGVRGVEGVLGRCILGDSLIVLRQCGVNRGARE